MNTILIKDLYDKNVDAVVTTTLEREEVQDIIHNVISKNDTYGLMDVVEAIKKADNKAEIVNYSNLEEVWY